MIDHLIGNMHFQKSDFEAAIPHYQTAIAKHSRFLRAHKNLGICLLRTGRETEALPHITRAIELGDHGALSYGQLGFAYARSGNNIAAESAYRMACLLDPETRDWQMGLARSFFDQRRFTDAIALLDVLIEKDPNSVDLWMIQGNAYLRLEQPLKAAENLEIVDELGGSTPDSLNLLADIYVNAALYGVAVDAYVRALELDATVPPNRAVAAAATITRNGAFSTAETLLDAVERLRAGQFDVDARKEFLKVRAMLAVATEATEAEVEALEEIVALDPLDGDAIILLGRYYTRVEDYVNAEFNFERAAQIEDYEAEAKMRHGQMLVKQKLYQEAVPLLERSLFLKPSDVLEDYLRQVQQKARS